MNRSPDIAFRVCLPPRGAGPHRGGRTPARPAVQARVALQYLQAVVSAETETLLHPPCAWARPHGNIARPSPATFSHRRSTVDLPSPLLHGALAETFQSADDNRKEGP